ncbi:DUF4352 domain-containing protein [Modestobacter lapidis]|nr:DUF4352 domain-containing protein [Modestobacter lapidis]
MTQAPAMPQLPEQPQVETKKPLYKRKWFVILAAIIVIAIFANIGGGGDDTTAPAAADAATGGQPVVEQPVVEQPVAEEPVAEEVEAPAPTNPGIGQPAADGKFQFVVNGVDCSATELGSEYFSTTAQGQFCMVDLTITNVGDKPQSFFGDNAKLFNAQGQEFSADSEAAIYLEDSASLYEEINPGNALNSKVVFDVPAGTAPTSIELHDSMFSGGVTVNLQ